MNDDLPVIALFDFDGTITTRDSLLPFFFFLYGFWGIAKITVKCLPKLIGFVLKFTPRQEAKEALLTAAFAGMTPAQLHARAVEYAEGSLNHLVKPEALQKIHWHQQSGHRCIIVSASVSVYLSIWAKNHGFSDLLCSELALDSLGCYTGKLMGKNCWGEEKVARVSKLLGERKKYKIYAYGDSRGDREMLAYADYPFYNRWS